MNESQQETVAIKACAACWSGLLERDKFCRKCGARQPDAVSSTADQFPNDEQVASHMTSVLVAAAPDEVYRRISASLVSAVLNGGPVVTSTRSQSTFLKRVILALVSIPVWLIIVLLSPFDAYAAVKSLERQI